jgi:hypothetical protein
MSTTLPSANEFAWEVQPAAARWVSQAIASFRERNERIDRLADVLRNETGTRLIDWIDHLAIDAGSEENQRLANQLADVGYVSDSEIDRTIWRHRRGLFPPVLLGAGLNGLAIRVDWLDDCLAALPAALGINARCEELFGQLGGQFRQACLYAESGDSPTERPCAAHVMDYATPALWAVERHGYQGLVVPHAEVEQIDAAAGHLKAFRSRERSFFRSEEGFEYAIRLIAAAADDVGTDWACDLFFSAEREYWQSRNHGAQVQYERQNRLGLGWANHDHHTYRSSRPAFRLLIATLEQLGFFCRERFYAGREAGWGAQVLEQPECRVVIFADVDLSPEEVSGDFAHEPLAERDELGTVGLWCELHGEAFLEAGMHHLECQFDFDAARAQLASAGIETMAPFTDFSHLRQAFTAGETWPVDPQRVERLLVEGRINEEQSERFLRDGAIGSHMEILERNDGYKGFNQTGISEIIARTDPRRMVKQ